jgi:hypothetical protein
VKLGQVYGVALCVHHGLMRFLSLNFAARCAIQEIKSLSLEFPHDHSPRLDCPAFDALDIDVDPLTPRSKQF